MVVLYIILAALAAFVALLLIRAAAFKPQKEAPVAAQPEQFDRDKAVRDLQALIRCKTVSYRDRALEDDAEFDKLWEEMVNTCKSYGYDAYVAEKIEHIHACFDACGIAYEK